MSDRRENVSKSVTLIWKPTRYAVTWADQRDEIPPYDLSQGFPIEEAVQGLLWGFSDEQDAPDAMYELEDVFNKPQLALNLSKQERETVERVMYQATGGGDSTVWLWSDDEIEGDPYGEQKDDYFPRLVLRPDAGYEYLCREHDFSDYAHCLPELPPNDRAVVNGLLKLNKKIDERLSASTNLSTLLTPGSTIRRMILNLALQFGAPVRPRANAAQDWVKAAREVGFYAEALNRLNDWGFDDPLFADFVKGSEIEDLIKGHRTQLGKKVTDGDSLRGAVANHLLTVFNQEISKRRLIELDFEGIKVKAGALTWSLYQLAATWKGAESLRFCVGCGSLFLPTRADQKVCDPSRSACRQRYANAQKGKSQQNS